MKATDIKTSNTEAEQVVLGAILLENRCFPTVKSILSGKEVFIKLEHQHIYRMMLALFDNTEPIDLTTLNEALRGAKVRSKDGGMTDASSFCGGMVYLANLMDFAVTPANVAFHAKIVQKYSIKRKMLFNTYKLIDSLEKDKDEEVEKCLQIFVDTPRAVNQFENIFTAQDLKNMILPPLKWIVPNVLPVGFSILAGKPKVGKSFLSLGLCEAVATGGSAWGLGNVPQGEVLYLALEDSQARLKRRMTSIKSKWADAFHIAIEWRKIEDGGLDELKSWILKHPDIRLIVIDTLVKMLGGRKNKATLYEEDYERIAPLQKFASENDICILGVTHLRKQGSDDIFEMITGSTGTTGASDGCLALSRENNESQEGQLELISRETEYKKIKMAFDPITFNWVASDSSVSSTSEREKIIEAIEEHFFSGARPKELSDLLEKSYNSTKTLLHRMLKNNELEKRDGKYFVVKNVLPFD